MLDFVSRLKPLSKDPGRYWDVVLTGFCKIAKKDVEREEICRYKSDEVANWSHDDQCNILGVEVGEGIQTLLIIY